MNLLKKLFLLCVTVFGLFLCSMAHPVDLKTAQSIAAKFMATNDLQLVTTYQTDKNIAAFYVFNTTDGFVIVSADDCETPIIGYSQEGRFDPNNVPIQMEDYLQDFVTRIQYSIENHIVADEVTARQWDLVKTTGKLNDSKSAKAVEPLLTEKWHQGCLYNSLCPAMSGPCDRAEVGCVAVAMGQIMHYWHYPATGWGSHSYSNTGTTLSANFGDTTYDWDHMPDSLTENSSEAEIEAVATLLFHCGVSVDMKYTTSGSITGSANVPNALTRYFDYSRHIRREKKDDYSTEEWGALLKNCLDLQRPILYSGFGDSNASNVGHAFVCDGYDDNDLFHFNWGWGTANGYFAMGNLCPIGTNFNSNNFAILDIVPQYEPCIVTASVYPPNAGTIEGTGGYHIGEQCTLIPTPAVNSKFLHWKKDGRIVSSDLHYTFNVTDDIDGIEAVFSFLDVKQITASYSPDANNPSSPCVSLSWNTGDTEWTLLKQFDINGENGLAIANEYIYTCNHLSIFRKYTMDGELIDCFNIAGAIPDGMTWDGNYFYCSNNNNYYNVFYLYCYDIEHETLIDSANMHMQFAFCSYDAENDGFWLCNNYSNRTFALKDRQGQTIMNGPSYPSSYYYDPVGSGVITAEDGSRHLLVVLDSGGIHDYDISNGIVYNHPGLSLQGTVKGASIGKYEGKDAMFVVSYYYYTDISTVYIFEINHHLPQIIGYRLYRADSEENTVTLSDEVTGTSFVDSTWNNASAGIYRFGISMVFANGNESEVIWSEPIEKSGHGLNEGPDDHEDDPSVQKVLENGQIVIIKKGTRYNVSGQRLN